MGFIAVIERKPEKKGRRNDLEFARNSRTHTRVAAEVHKYRITQLGAQLRCATTTARISSHVRTIFPVFSSLSSLQHTHTHTGDVSVQLFSSRKCHLIVKCAYASHAEKQLVFPSPSSLTVVDEHVCVL